MVYRVGLNMPGYLPDYAPQWFNDIDEAHDYLCDELSRVLDQFPPDDDMTPQQAYWFNGLNATVNDLINSTPQQVQLYYVDHLGKEWSQWLIKSE